MGSAVGLITFLAGLAILGWTLQMAFDLYRLSPADALGVVKGKPIDPATTGGAFGTTLIRVGLLVVMALVGSLVANKGAVLYSASRGLPAKAD